MLSALADFDIGCAAAVGTLTMRGTTDALSAVTTETSVATPTSVKSDANRR